MLKSRELKLSPTKFPWLYKYHYMMFKHRDSENICLLDWERITPICVQLDLSPFSLHNIYCASVIGIVYLIDP
mgnify:CR=1 FL=1